MTTTLSVLGFLFLVGIGSVVALTPRPATWTPIPQRWREVVAKAAAPVLGLAVLAALLMIRPALAIGAGVLAGLGWYLLTVLPKIREKRAVDEDILALVVHLRLALGRGVPPRGALRSFAVDVQPGRPLAERIERCLKAVQLGWDFKRAFLEIVVRDNRHLRRLSQMLQALEKSQEPQEILARFTERVIGEMRQELRVQNRRRLMIGLVTTVLLMMVALMIALLEPTLWTMLQVFGAL